ncbi:20325_t:CDS:2, partial [Gigaspora rosea]
VEKVLFDEDEYEKIRKRKLIIQGLVPASLEKESMVERYFKNKAFKALGLKFHEKIWTLCCKAVAKWEELSVVSAMLAGISLGVMPG